VLRTVVLAVAIALLLASSQAFADPLAGDVSRQRIGNYDFEVATDPSPPQAGEPAMIMLRIAGVNGDDLVDVPMQIRIEKDGQTLQRAGPLVVPSGHYNYTYAFPEPGRYVLYADLRDYAYSGEVLTFTFFLNVPGPADYLLPGIGAAAAATVGAIVILRRRRHG
jgi:hypothetical protein